MKARWLAPLVLLLVVGLVVPGWITDGTQRTQQGAWRRGSRGVLAAAITRLPSKA